MKVSEFIVVVIVSVVTSILVVSFCSYLKKRDIEKKDRELEQRLKEESKESFGVVDVSNFDLVNKTTMEDKVKLVAYAVTALMIMDELYSIRQSNTTNGLTNCPYIVGVDLRKYSETNAL